MTEINNNIVADISAANELKELSTPQLWDRVGSAHSEFENVRRTMASGLRTCAQQALLLGECLTILQQRTTAGTWIATVEQNCGIGIREVQRYQQLFLQREALAAIDPQWQENLTITEALEKLRLTSIQQSTEATTESRAARKKARAQSNEEKADSSTDTGTNPASDATQTSAARKKPKEDKRTTNAGSAKQCLGRILLGAKGFRLALEHAVKAKQLNQIQQRVVEARDEIEALLQECDRKRQQIEAKESNTKKPVKANAKKQCATATLTAEVPFVSDSAKA